MTATIDDLIKEEMKNPDFAKDFNQYLQRNEIAMQVVSLRKSEKISQEELADRSGLAKSTIARIENGNMDPTIKTLQKIAKAGNKHLLISFEDQRMS